MKVVCNFKGDTKVFVITDVRLSNREYDSSYQSKKCGQISCSGNVCFDNIGSGCTTNGTALLCIMRAFLANA